MVLAAKEIVVHAGRMGPRCVDLLHSADLLNRTAPSSAAP
jgi:hypothetical protein